MAGTALVNDIHSQLNPTRVREVASPASLDALRQATESAWRRRLPICAAGGRHCMGGQQFATDAVLLDTTRLSRVLQFDADTGRVQVEAGIQWPRLMDDLADRQNGTTQPWTIAQKQTGANRLTVGGALGANVHGRGLCMAPFGADIESLTLLDAEGRLHLCSREQNAELFRLVIGGYGLFGVVYSATLRLVPRQKVQRIVEAIPLQNLTSAFTHRIADGFLYGDFQFNIDPASPGFLRRGVFSCYRPVDPSTPFPDAPKHLSREDWGRLVYLAHVDKAQAFRLYTEHYLSTSGQVYWSDTHQLAVYLDDYHRDLDQQLGARYPATEVITELYVPRPRLADFLEETAEDFRAHGVNLIYGTVRLIRRDTDSFLAWAKQDYTCVIFNLHVEHSPVGKEQAAQAFRRLIDSAIRRDGSFYLAYHRHATRSQVEACYPQFAEFLRLKGHYDPQERFQSDWYRHYRELFAGN